MFDTLLVTIIAIASALAGVLVGYVHGSRSRL